MNLPNRAAAFSRDLPHVDYNEPIYTVRINHPVFIRDHRLFYDSSSHT